MKTYKVTLTYETTEKEKAKLVEERLKNFAATKRKSFPGMEVGTETWGKMGDFTDEEWAGVGARRT
jgi:hypothetical protein